MVHDEFPSDMWYHDAMLECFLISNWNRRLSWKYKYPGYLDKIEPQILYEWSDEAGKSVPVDWNADKLTHYERMSKTVEEYAEKLNARFSESLVLAGYYASTGLITQEEYNRIEEWYDTVSKLVSDITRSCRMIRGWKDMSDEEYDIIGENVPKLADLVREAIRDRYVFEREVEKRQRDKTRWKI
jgi:hypothetical protein